MMGNREVDFVEVGRGRGDGGNGRERRRKERECRFLNTNVIIMYCRCILIKKLETIISVFTLCEGNCTSRNRRPTPVISAESGESTHATLLTAA